LSTLDLRGGIVALVRQFVKLGGYLRDLGLKYL